MVDTNNEECIVDSVNDLRFHIHILGYYPQGECELIVVYDENKNEVQKAILIDCYYSENNKILFDLFAKYNISLSRPLDMLIWTHPDKDHSHGICTVLKHVVSKKTVIFVPDGIGRKSLFKAALFSYLNFRSLAAIKGLDVERVNSSNKRKYPNIFQSVIFKDAANRKTEFYVDVLSPFSSKIFKKQEIDKNFKNNDLSIALMIHFGEMDFFFGGDVENPTLRMIQKGKFTNTRFIKIPHHGSKRSDYLLDVLHDSNLFLNEVIAVSTIFKIGRSNLPEDSVLDLYNNVLAEIYCTDSLPRIYMYGLCSFVYNVNANLLEKSKCSWTGDSKLWCPK